MTSKISFHCPSCLARIKAPAQLLGKRRSCPGCNHSFVVREKPEEKSESGFTPPEDAGPILITDSDTVDVLLEAAETKAEQGKRLGELEKENARLKQMLSRMVGSGSA